MRIHPFLPKSLNQEDIKKARTDNESFGLGIGLLTGLANGLYLSNKLHDKTKIDKKILSIIPLASGIIGSVLGGYLVNKSFEKGLNLPTTNFYNYTKNLYEDIKNIENMNKSDKILEKKGQFAISIPITELNKFKPPKFKKPEDYALVGSLAGILTGGIPFIRSLERGYPSYSKYFLSFAGLPLLGASLGYGIGLLKTKKEKEKK